MLALLIGTVLVSGWIGRWRVVEAKDYRPLVD
jgi:hypothetical protein